MDRFVDYINSALPEGKKHNEILYKFKREILEEMKLRKGETLSRGIQNETVAEDLAMSEHPDLKAEYEEFSRKEYSKIRTKRNAILNIVGSAIYLLVIVVSYLMASFATHAWNKTWGIITTGVLFWVAYLLFLGVRKFASMKKIFHVFARIFLAADITVLTVGVFLFFVAFYDIEKSWLIMIFGLMYMFICDAAFAVIAKHRMALINCLLYVPVIAVFLFIIIGALEIVAWKYAWIIIPLSLIIDLIVILFAIGKNKMDKLEVADVWNEN
ncbi:MAG: hypothetical protein IJT65_01860 [Eubacterium sp.]|nr:hypothetical protein [Eubacterium sp.]